MANLSNINNKFLFTDGDFLKIGNLAPINNISGTESGISITNGNCASITLDNSAASGKPYVIFSAVDGSLKFYDVDAGSNRLVISTAGDATVSGNITAVRGFFNSGSTNVVATFTSTDGIAGIALVDSSGNVELSASGNTFQVQPAGGVAQLTVGTSSSTFAGKIITPSSGTIIEAGGADAFGYNATSGRGFYIRGTGSTYIYGGGKFYSGGTAYDLLYNTQAADATFSGKVGIGTTSPSYPLEINSAVTGGGMLSIMSTGVEASISHRINSGATNTGWVTGNYNADYFIYSYTLGSQAITIKPNGNVGIGVVLPTSKLTLPQEEENGFKIEFTGGSYSSGISTVDQAGSGLYIGTNSYVNSGGLITYKDSALDSNGIYFDAWNGNNMEFYTALSGTPQQRMSIAGDGAVVINGTTNLVGKLRVGGTTLATSNLHVYSSFGNGGSLWSIGADATYAYTAHKQWTSFDGAYSTGVFYTIGVIQDSRSAIINVKTAAHSTATLLVSRGYGPSNLSRFQVLSSTKNPNGGYANITDVQISGGGKVDIKLAWSSGPNVAIEVTVYGNGFTIANTLQASTATVGSNYPDNVLWDHALPSDAGSAMVAGQLRVTGNIVNPATFGTTTGSAANMHVDSNGTFFRSTSSLKYKTDVRDYDKGLNEVMQLKPKYYKGNDDGNVQFAGLIAEDVHDLGLNEFVQYAKDGTPDALAYPNMIALLTKAIQELKADNDSLKARIETLENN